MSDYRDPKVTAPKSATSSPWTWIGIAVAVLVILLLIWWLWPADETDEVAAPPDAEVESADPPPAVEEPPAE